MAEDIKTALAKIVNTFGTDIFYNQKKFIAVLSDFNINRKDINLLTCITKVSYFSEYMKLEAKDAIQMKLLVNVVTQEFPYNEQQILDVVEALTYAVNNMRKSVQWDQLLSQKNNTSIAADAEVIQRPTQKHTANSIHREGIEQYLKYSKKQNKANRAYDPSIYKGPQNAAPVVTEDSYETSYSEAFDSCKSAAERGDTISQNNLGVMFQEGIGVPKNNREAVRWYNVAAEAGNIHAQQNLGWMYRNGYGVPQDCAKAMEWYKKSAAAGHMLAQNNMGWLYQNGYGVEKDNVQAFICYKIAAQQGDQYAQTNLAFMYERGLGVEKNFEESVKWYKSACEQGNMQAFNNMGFMYERGYGVTIDYGEAARWYKKSAEMGFMPAQINIMRFNRIGLGIRRNAAAADRWLATVEGSKDAFMQRVCGWCFVNGCGVHESIAEAEKWYMRAALRGDADAEYNLGLIYMSVESSHSYGYERRLDAIKWFKKAAAKGNTDAKKLLTALIQTTQNEAVGSEVDNK